MWSTIQDSVGNHGSSETMLTHSLGGIGSSPGSPGPSLLERREKFPPQIMMDESTSTFTGKLSKVVDRDTRLHETSLGLLTMESLTDRSPVAGH